ncbi:MAG: hypothetical protein ACREVK_13815 [Gammaproteobacteria bacterium]
MVRVAIVVGLVVLAGYGVERGIAVRRWAWDFTEAFRFTGDIGRGFSYGRKALREGYIDLYSRKYAETTARGEKNDLNYAPLRLATMMWYAWVVSDDYPEATQWQRYPYGFTLPVLGVNMVMELAAGAAAFVLVVIWMSRAQRAGDAAPLPTVWSWLRDLSPFTGWFTATVAAALVWFNPASWINAHGWPLWDIWVVPFFLWALVFISLDCWLVAGVVIGVGAMFKGQQFLVAPLFVMTALFMGRPGAAGRWVAGLVLGLALVVWPWMLTHRFEPIVPEGATEATMRDPAAPLWNLWAIAWVGAVAAVFISLLVVSYVMRWPWRAATPALVAVAVGAAMFACVPMFDADLGWLRVGLLRGTEVFSNLYVAHAYNIPALLAQQFGFSNKGDLTYVVTTLAGHEVTLKQLMATIYFVTLVLCSAGAARHWRRNDPRTLVALIAPWLLLFTIVTQMHERYLLFAAAMSATLIAVRWPYVFMCVLLSFLSMCMTADTMLGASSRALRRGQLEGDMVSVEQFRMFLESVNAIFPGAAWAVVACCIVVLVDALGVGGLRVRRRVGDL